MQVRIDYQENLEIITHFGKVVLQWIPESNILITRVTTSKKYNTEIVNHTFSISDSNGFEITLITK